MDNIITNWEHEQEIKLRIELTEEKVNFLMKNRYPDYSLMSFHAFCGQIHIKASYKYEKDKDNYFHIIIIPYIDLIYNKWKEITHYYT